MSSPAHLVAIPFFMFLICLPSCATTSYSNSSKTGFSIPVIHRDSPMSPLYNPNATDLDRLNASYQRSIYRNHYHSKMFPAWDVTRMRPIPGDEPYGFVYPGSGEYLMRYEIGSPINEVYGVIDTGSPLIWLQCKPCKKCYKQKLPIFNPEGSHTFQKVACSDSRCRAITRRCPGIDRDCEYYTAYEDRSHSGGVLATERFSLVDDAGYARKFTMENVMFGCGYDNGGIFKEDQMGIIGLNTHRLSLISQLDVTRFSHCFVSEEDKNLRGYFNFGHRAEMRGVKCQITEDKLLYYVGLDSISVGGDKVPVPEDAFTLKPNGMGGFYTDTGMTFSTLQKEVYDAVVTAIVSKAQLPRAKGRNTVLDLCPVVTSIEDRLRLPLITLHLVGVDWTWGRKKTYIRNSNNLMCLAVIPGETNSGLGNYQMQNMDMGYDLDAKRLYLDDNPGCDPKDR